MVSAAFMAFGCAQLVRAQNPDDKGTQPRTRSGIFTMYALDPLSRTFCFNDGKEGMAIAHNQLGNRCSDLSYSLAGNGVFVGGIEVNRVAAFVRVGGRNQHRQK